MYDLEYALDHKIDDIKNYWEYNEIFKLYSPQSNQKVLEIGCNTGEFCHLLQEKFNVKPVGIDVNKDAIDLALSNFPELDCRIKDLFELSDNFDVVYMLQVIEHLDDPHNALIKLKQILNENGVLLLSCPNKWAYLQKLTHYLNNQKFCYDPTHVSEFNPYSIRRLLTQAGFNRIKMFTKTIGIPYFCRYFPNLDYKIPALWFGAHIFISARK